jgi:hypothetical protein
MGKKSDPPAPPDLTPQAEASEEIARINQETAREQLAWAREQDTANRAVLERAFNCQSWKKRLPTRKPIGNATRKFSSRLRTT